MNSSGSWTGSGAATGVGNSVNWGSIPSGREGMTTQQSGSPAQGWASPFSQQVVISTQQESISPSAGGPTQIQVDVAAAGK